MDNEAKQQLVLVVDDDTTSRMLMRKTLERAGFAVAEASNGVECLATFERMPPNIILLDVEMPEMNGFVACKRIRQMPEGQHVPILMVTGLDDVESVNRAYEVGATDFTSKPLNWPVLGHRVRYMLRASEAFRNVQISEARTRALLRAMPDSMIRMSLWGDILDMHLGQDAQIPLSVEDTVDRTLGDVMGDNFQRAMLELVKDAMASHSTQSVEVDFPPGEEARNYEIRLVISADNEVLTVIRDITERKEAEQRMRFLAFYDSLTGLPNRQLFSIRLEHALQRAQKQGTNIAVFLIDLDVFQRINDTLGHGMGDLLLKGMGKRLKQVMMEHTDYDGRDEEEEDPTTYSTAARLGGDEFVLLLEGVDDAAENVRELAREVTEAISVPMALSGQEVVVTPSMGIVISPDDGETVDTLLMNADTAMYHAKKEGRNNFQFYAGSMNERSLERLSLENRLRKALEQDELVLHYQPQIDVKSGRVTGVEALVRWMNPDLGMVSPGEFIPLAEETGLILPLGEWVLVTACRQCKAWQDQGLPRVRVAVNLAGEQFRQQKFAKAVERTMKEIGLDTEYLELEITEGTIMSNATDTIVTLEELKATGLALAVDDFGTGYSSLSYLKRFPIDYLKIDQAFVRDVTDNPEDAGIVRAIIAMAKSLKLKTIAEGVETREHVEFLKAEGADVLQGYFFSRPVDAETCAELLGKTMDV